MKKRCLHLTRNAIHLNSAGAQVVAEIYASEIKRLAYKNQEHPIQNDMLTFR